MIRSLSIRNYKYDIILWLLFFVVFGGLFALSYVYVVPAEDAVILYEYAKNFAQTGLITYGGASVPIEGATDFLWMVVIAFLKVLGINEFASALFINFLCLAIMASLFRNSIEKLLVGAAILVTPFLYSSLSGFSTITFSTLYVIAIKLLLDRSKYLYFSILVLCLVRPDGVVWGAGLVLIRVLQCKTFDEFKGEFSRCLSWLVVPGLIYFIFRYWYFGELFPLPFLVKSSGHANLLIFHSSSLKAIVIVLFPLVLAVVALLKDKKEVAQFILLFLLPVVFYASMRLEQNIGNRFLAPMFFGGLYLLSRQYEMRATIIFVLLSAYTMHGATLSTANSVANSSNENIYYLAKDLKQIYGKMLITEAGRLTYYSDWHSDDSWGLNTPKYAHRLITSEDVRQGSYDLIVAHCDLDMLDPKYDLIHDGQRSWTNQCKTLVSVIRQDEFSVYLVPFRNENPTLLDRIKSFVKAAGSVPTQSCERHDIYAVSNQFQDRKKLENLLFDHGGVAYNLNMDILYDTVCSESH
jgi:hypothetical protein